MNHAVILAGGVGSRTGLEIPKQYYTVNGKPILVYTLEKFQECKCIDSICVVTLPEFIEEVRQYKNEYGISKLNYVVKCGITGIQSAYNGLMSIEGAKATDLVIFHDGVRPFIDVDTIERNVNVAASHNVAVTAVPCIETLVKTETDDGYSDTCIPRDGLMRVQTPQTFRYKDIVDVLDGVDIPSIDHPSLFSYWMSLGRPVYCSIGNEKNIKITYYDDIKYFEKLFG